MVRDIGEWRPGFFAERLLSIVVWPGEPFLRKCTNFKRGIVFDSGDVPKIKKFKFFRDKSPAGNFKDLASRHKGASQNQKMKI